MLVQVIVRSIRSGAGWQMPGPGALVPSGPLAGALVNVALVPAAGLWPRVILLPTGAVTRSIGARRERRS